MKKKNKTKQNKTKQTKKQQKNKETKKKTKKKLFIAGYNGYGAKPPPESGRELGQEQDAPGSVGGLPRSGPTLPVTLVLGQRRSRV